MITGGLKLLVAGLVVLNAIGASAAAPAGVDHPCAPSKELSTTEHNALMLFNANLSHLGGWYGKQAFDSRLEAIVQKQWPTQTILEISPYYYEKVSNMVEQARLKNAIASTIGLEVTEWTDFERQLKDISFFGGLGGVSGKPLDKVTEKLLRKIGSSTRKTIKMDKIVYENKKAEAIARTVDMHTFMIRWKAMNREITNERAAAAAKNMAVIGMGLVGSAVLVGGFAVAGPVVAGAGVVGAGLSTTPAVSFLLAGLAETAAGSILGMVGSPATLLITDSYSTLANAKMNSLNKQTVYSCELSKEMADVRRRAPARLLSAAILGAGMGAGGGLLTFWSKSAKAVLVSTIGAVGVAQGYALWTMGTETLAALSFYKLAETASNEGNFADAKAYLIEARQHAVNGGNQAIESIIVGTLSLHVAGHYKVSFQRGAGEIRKLWANSADTIPTAAKSASNLLPVGPQPALATAACVPGAPNYALCLSQNAAVASR